MQSHRVPALENGSRTQHTLRSGGRNQSCGDPQRTRAHAATMRLLPLLFLLACGARDQLGAAREEQPDAAPTPAHDAAADADVAEVRAPAEAGQEAGPVGCWRCAELWAPDCSQPTTDAEMCVACGMNCVSDAGGE